MEHGKIIETQKGYFLRRATLQDVQDLLNLYFKTYGANYPLALGTDRNEMTRIVSDPHDLWIVAISDQSIGQQGEICGSCVFEVDMTYKIGRAEGLVVHPNYQQKGIASALLSQGSKYLIDQTKSIHSMYTTTRTVSLGPQLAVLRDAYIPLGIFPNAHRLATYETLTLMAKFDPDVLHKRRLVKEVPEALGSIIKALEKFIKSRHPAPRLLEMTKPKANGEALDFDFIHAPHYVRRRFSETFTNRYDRFYPFHTPNFMMSAKNGEVDIYGYISQADGYCAWVASTKPVSSLAGRLRLGMQQLSDYGVSYVEILTTTDNIRGLEMLLDLNFLPSAIYPAMLQVNDEFVDMVLMSRSMEPLNFHGMHLEKSFKPYIDQYVDLWKTMHLEVLNIFDQSPIEKSDEK